MSQPRIPATVIALEAGMRAEQLRAAAYESEERAARHIAAAGMAEPAAPYDAYEPLPIRPSVRDVMQVMTGFGLGFVSAMALAGLV